jgi:alpha-L-rhamnosidase
MNPNRFCIGFFVLAFAMNCLAARPDGKLLVITDAGAVGDGKTLNTEAIQKAIDQLAASGGGTIVIPQGTFLSGAIFLKPGIGLYLDKDAILKGTTNIRDYPKMQTRIEGHFQIWIPALVNADHIDHLRIGGEGTLDGSGAPFYAEFRSRIATQRSTTNLDVERPRMMYISQSNDVQVSGLHFLNSGFWNLHLYRCNGVKVDGLDINALAGSPSTDGMDVDSCQNVDISHCTIANNDDCVALKGTKGPQAMSDTTSPPDEHIHISYCTINRGPCIVTCGSEATIVRDVTVDHCTISGGTGTRGLSLLRLKLRPDTPEEYSDIHLSDITMNGSGQLINVAPWTQYYQSPGGPRSAHDITFTNIHGGATALGAIRGNPGDSLYNFTFENIDLQIPNNRGQMVGVKNLVFKNVMINGKPYEPPAATQPAR